MNAHVGDLEILSPPAQFEGATAAELATIRQLAAFHLTYGRAETADRLLRIVLWLDPGDMHAVRLKAQTAAYLGRPVEAAEMLMRALKSQKANVTFGDWKSIGRAFIKAGRLKSAKLVLFRE